MMCIIGNNKIWLNGQYVWHHFNDTINSSIYYCDQCDSYLFGYSGSKMDITIFNNDMDEVYKEEDILQINIDNAYTNIITFDVDIEDISIGINHEYISSATGLIEDYAESLLLLKSKIYRNKNIDNKSNDNIIKSMGKIKCNTLSIFTCCMVDSDDEKYDNNEITARLQLNQLQIIKNLSPFYEEEDLMIPEDMRYIPTIPTIYEWIIEFNSFETTVSSHSPQQHHHKHKRKRLSKKQPLIRIWKSKFEQHCFIRDQSIRNIIIGEMSIQWNMIDHIYICKLLNLFLINIDELKHKLSQFKSLSMNTDNGQQLEEKEEYKDDIDGMDENMGFDEDMGYVYIDYDDQTEEEKEVNIPTLLITHSIDIDMKFDHKSNDATLHIYIDKVERPSYLTVYRDRFQALNIDIFSSSLTIKEDKNVFLPYILHDDKLLHEVYIECYKYHYNEEILSAKNKRPKTPIESPSYFQTKRQKSQDRNDENALSLNFHAAKDDNWKTFILKHGSFGMGNIDNLIEFDQLKIYHSGKPDNQYLENDMEFEDEMNKEYYDKNTYQPNLHLIFDVFMFKLPHDFYFGDILLGSILKRWKAFKLWFKYTLRKLQQKDYHIPITLDIANMLITAKEFQVEFKENPNNINLLIAEFMSGQDIDVGIREKFEYLNQNMDRWSYGNGLKINNEHDLAVIFQNVVRICGNKLYIALELDEECLTLDDTLQTLQVLDSYQPAMQELTTSINPWYELWCKQIEIKANNLCTTISGYALPLISTPYLEVKGKFILGQLLCPQQRFIEHHIIDLTPTLNIDLASHEFIPVKVYCDLSAKIFGKESLLTYGKCMEPGIDKFALCMDRMTKSIKKLKFGKLAWWDKLRMKFHGNIQIDVKHTNISIIKQNHSPDYLSVDIDHGLLIYKRGVFNVLTHSVSMQVIGLDRFFNKFDILQVNNLKEMYEIPAVNKDHTVARIHFLNINARLYWQSKQDDPYQHYFHHTYWSHSLLFQDVVPDLDIDLYERYRAQKLTFKYRIRVEAPTQENVKNKAFLPGLDLRLWWQCNSWMTHLLETLTESDPSHPDKPELGPLLQPVTLECVILYPSVEILEILKKKEKPKTDQFSHSITPQNTAVSQVPTVHPQHLTLDIDDVMSTSNSSNHNLYSPSISKSNNPPSTPSKISRLRPKFTRKKSKDHIHGTCSLSEEHECDRNEFGTERSDTIPSVVELTEDEELKQYTLLGMRIRAKELLFRTKFIRSSQQHPLLDSEIITNIKNDKETKDVWLMKGKYLKFTKPKLELIVPQPSTKHVHKSRINKIFYHVSPFKAENCYGNFEIARFARSLHLVFSDMGYHKAEENIIKKQQNTDNSHKKFQFPYPVHPPSSDTSLPIDIKMSVPRPAPQYTAFRPPPLTSILTKNSLPPSPPLRSVNHSDSTIKSSAIPGLPDRTSSVNLLLQTQMFPKLNRARASVDDLESIPSHRQSVFSLISPDSDSHSALSQNELIRTLSTQSNHDDTDDSSPDASVSPIKFNKEEIEKGNKKEKVRRGSFHLELQQQSPSGLSMFDLDEPGNSTVYDSWVVDDLKMLWNEEIRQTTLNWWPLLFDKTQNDDIIHDTNDDTDDDTDDDEEEDDMNGKEVIDRFIHEPINGKDDFVSSLSQLLNSATNGKKPRIVSDADDGEGGKDKEDNKEMKHPQDGSQPLELEYYKQRLWLVHLQRPQIKFQAVNKDAIILGAHHAFVQGFGFHLELLPSKTKDMKNIQNYLPPEEMIYRLENTQYYDIKMPYFKIRICGSLIDAQMFVEPANIDHIDKWIPTDQLEYKSDSLRSSKSKHNMNVRSNRRRSSDNNGRNNKQKKLKKDNALKAVVGHCKLQFAYSYDLEIVDNSYSDKIVPFHWTSFAENNIISTDYETESFVPNTATLNVMPELNRGRHSHRRGDSLITSPLSPNASDVFQKSLIRHLYKTQQQQPYSGNSYGSDQFSKLLYDEKSNNTLQTHQSSSSRSDTTTSSSSQHTLQNTYSNTIIHQQQQQQLFHHQDTFIEHDNNVQKTDSNKPSPYSDWIGRQHIPFMNNYNGEPTSNTKVYLPTFIGKLDPYQFQTFMNVINFVLLASHQTNEEMEQDNINNDDQLNNISITKQQRHLIQKELQETVNKSFETSRHSYSVNKIPLKIVEYQTNSISWKMADINSNTFVNTQITNFTGSHVLCSDLSREADMELQHFQVTQPSKKEDIMTQYDATQQIKGQKSNSSSSVSSSSLCTSSGASSPSKLTKVRSKSLDLASKSPSKTPSEASIVSESISHEYSVSKSGSISSKLFKKKKKKKGKKKKSKFKQSLAKKGKKIIHNLFHSHKSRSISPKRWNHKLEKIDSTMDSDDDDDDDVNMNMNENENENENEINDIDEEQPIFKYDRKGEISPPNNDDILRLELKRDNDDEMMPTKPPFFTSQISDNQYTKIMIQPQPEEWKRFSKNVKQQSRRMMLTIRADKCKPHKINYKYFGLNKLHKMKQETPCISLYKHLEINLFPIKIDLDLKHAKQLRDYFFIATINEGKNKNTEQHRKQFLDYFQKQYLNINDSNITSHQSSNKSFTFSDADQRIGDMLINQQQSDIISVSSPHGTTTMSTTKKEKESSLSNERYFHRIRIGRLHFDISFTGWVKDVHKQISVSPFIYTNRLSTWSKLIQSLGSHAFRDVVFGGVTQSHLNPLQIDNLFSSKKKKKIFENLDDTEKRQRLLFGATTEKKRKQKEKNDNDYDDNDDDDDEFIFDENKIPKDSICLIDITFDRYSLLKIMNECNKDNDNEDLEELFRDSLIVQVIHDRLLLELRTILEHIYNSNNLSLIFEFEILKKLNLRHLKIKILLRKVGEFDNDENEIDKLDLIEKYRIFLQSLIVAKHDKHKLSAIIKYLYNAKNVTIQPIRDHI